MGWLDEHIGQIGSVFERTFGPQNGGHKHNFLRTVEASLNFVPEEAGPESGKRFEIDLLPFVHPSLETLSSRVDLDSHRIEHMKCVELDARNQQLLSDHFTRTGFNYIDFPRDRFRVGSEYCVRAVFVRSATLLMKDGRVAPMFSSKYLIFDVIFGRANKLTRQRLSWRTPGMSVVQACIQADEDYPGEDVKPTTMLAMAGMDLENTLALLRAIALTAVASAVIDRKALGTGCFDAGNLDKRSAA